jgi:parallel beta-helix repeat protein
MADIGCDKLESAKLGRIKILGSIIAAVLIAITFLWALSIPLGFQTEPSSIPAKIAYTSHAPISISDNSQFTALNGVIGGSGTAGDPYIISGWDISAATANGIEIQGTISYFIIRDCYIHDGGLNYEGIYLYLCSHGTVSSNTCIDNYDGIYVCICNNITVTNNKCSSHDQIDLYGIFLDASWFNTIRGNNCSDNDVGISLIGSDNNVVSDNICVSNSHWDGIWIDDSDHNTISNNTCTDNGDEGIYISSSYHNMISGNICNLNDYDGIGVDISFNNIIDNNNCSLNSNSGIWLNYSSTNTITCNQIRNNSWPGIDIDSGSSYNRIWNNTIISNHGSGSIYDSSHIQAADNGTNNYWNSSNRGNFWSDWTSPDNSQPWRIVDLPYNLSGSAGAKDYLPLSSPHEASNPITTATINGTSGANGWFISNVTVTLSAIDTLSGVNETFYRNDTSGDWLPYSSPFVLSDEGNCTIQFYSRDNSGNNEAANSIIVKIDTIAPALMIDEKNNSIFKSPSISMHWNASDATSGIAFINVSLDSNDAFTALNITSTQMSWNNLTGGDHYVLFLVTDDAGNTAEIRIDFKVSLELISGIPDWLLITIIVLVIAAIISILVIRRIRGEKLQPQQPNLSPSPEVYPPPLSPPIMPPQTPPS